jgi:hypothetical protein
MVLWKLTVAPFRSKINYQDRLRFTPGDGSVETDRGSVPFKDFLALRCATDELVESIGENTHQSGLSDRHGIFFQVER